MERDQLGAGGTDVPDENADPRATLHPDRDVPTPEGTGSVAGAAPVIVEGYDHLELLGRGGSASVWRARQLSVDREVAIKVLDVTGVDDATIRRFQNEATALAQLSWNRHIVHIHDAGRTADGRPFLATELLEGGTLHEAIERRGPLEPDDVVRVGVAVSDALAAAHDAGVLHRDVKPDNVLLDRRDEPRLGDFGLARLGDSTTSTVGGTFGGTVLHAAPELFDGEQPTESSDLWSLGSTLYTAATGRAPFARADGGADSVTAIIRRTLLEDPPTLPPSVPEPLAELILSCLRKDPSDRMDSAATLHEQLLALQRGAPGSSPAAASSGGRSPGSRRRWVAAGAAAVVALGIAVTLSAGGDDEPDAGAPRTTAADVAGAVETPDPTAAAPTAAAPTSTTIDRDAATSRRTGVSNVRTAPEGLTDTSDALRARLDRFAATSGLAATASGPLTTIDGDGLGFGAPPTVFDYAAVNAERTAACSRLLIDDLAVVGAAAALWSDGSAAVLVNAVQTSDVRSARQYYWATTLFVGVDSSQCRDWPDGGIAWNPTEITVERSELSLPPGPDLQISAVDDTPDLVVPGGAVRVAYQALALWGDVVVAVSVGSIDGSIDQQRATEVLGRAIAAFGPG